MAVAVYLVAADCCVLMVVEVLVVSYILMYYVYVQSVI